MPQLLSTPRLKMGKPRHREAWVETQAAELQGPTVKKTKRWKRSRTSDLEVSDGISETRLERRTVVGTPARGRGQGEGCKGRL